MITSRQVLWAKAWTPAQSLMLEAEIRQSLARRGLEKAKRTYSKKPPYCIGCGETWGALVKGVPIHHAGGGRCGSCYSKARTNAKKHKHAA